MVVNVFLFILSFIFSSATLYFAFINSDVVYAVGIMAFLFTLIATMHSEGTQESEE
jgi:hypothetical protein